MKCMVDGCPDEALTEKVGEGIATKVADGELVGVVVDVHLCPGHRDMLRAGSVDHVSFTEEAK